MKGQEQSVQCSWYYGVSNDLKEAISSRKEGRDVLLWGFCIWKKLPISGFSGRRGLSAGIIRGKITVLWRGTFIVCADHFCPGQVGVIVLGRGNQAKRHRYLCHQYMTMKLGKSS